MRSRTKRHTESIADDVSGVRHTSMPGVARVELVRGSNIQKQVSQGRLQSIQGKVEDIETEDGQANCRIFRLL